MMPKPVTATRFTGTYPGRPDQVQDARRAVARHLAGCPALDDAILITSELASNAVIFFLLSSCVAITAIGRQADLRPALLGYLFLAAACCGTCETGQPPRSAGQLRHGYHRTRRLRKEVLHSASRGEFFTVRAELHADYVLVEAEDLGGPWRGRQHDDRPHGLDVVEALTGPDSWGTEPTNDGGRVVWARLDLAAGE
jgi:hypothetical protein